MDFFFKKPPPWPIFIFWERPFFWSTLYIVLRIFRGGMHLPLESSNNLLIMLKAWTHHVQMHSIRNRHQASPNTVTHKISLTAVPGYHRSSSRGCRCWWWRCSLASCRCRSGTRARSRRRSWAAPSGWASSRTRGSPCPCRWGGSSSRPASRSQCPSSQTSPHLPGNIDIYVNNSH